MKEMHKFMKKWILALLLAAALLFSLVPPQIFADEGNYTFTLKTSATTVHSGQTLSLSLIATGDSFDSYTTKIQYKSANFDLFDILSCTVPYTLDGNYICLDVSGDRVYEPGENGTEIARIKFGVKETGSNKRFTPKLSDAKAGMGSADTAVTTVNADQILCKPADLTNGKVEINVTVSPSGATEVSAGAYIGEPWGEHVTYIERGETVMLIASTFGSYVFKGWRLYGDEEFFSTNPRAFLSVGNYDTDVTAVFEEAHYDLSSLSTVKARLYRTQHMAVAGYPAQLSWEGPNVGRDPIWHLYAGEEVSEENEIEMNGTMFYMPEDIDKLTITLSYRSGEGYSEPEAATVDVSYGAASEDLLVREELPYAVTYHSGFIENTSIEIDNAAAFCDERTGALTIFGAGGWVSGILKKTDGSWISENVYGDAKLGDDPAHAAKMAGRTPETLLWYNDTSYNNIYLYAYEDGVWTQMTELKSVLYAIEDAEGLSTRLHILPLSSREDMLIGLSCSNENAGLYHYDGSSLTLIEPLKDIQYLIYVDEDRSLVQCINGHGTWIYNNKTGELTRFTPPEGVGEKILGYDFTYGSKDVLYLSERGVQQSGSKAIEYHLNDGNFREIDLSALTEDSPVAMGSAEDGYIYTVVMGQGNMSMWIEPTGFMGGEQRYIFRTNDYGENWELVKVEQEYDCERASQYEGNDNTPATPDPMKYPEEYVHILNPVDGVTVFVGNNGTFYTLYSDRHIYFDSMDGSDVETITAPINSAVSAPASPSNGSKVFVGWYLTEECNDEDKYAFTVMPGKDITLYAKWSDDSSALDGEKADAIEALEEAFASYDEDDYTEEGWAELTAAFENGKAEIVSASSYDAIGAALSSALEVMAAVKKSDIITVAVTIEKFTVDGKYIIEPTLINVKRDVKASIAITDLLKAYYPDYEGKPYRMTGLEDAAFYLAGVYDPTFVPDVSRGQRQGYEGFLSEFDCGEQSGWMYCIDGVFPSVGASGASLKNKDVMRWQYTCEKLGGDIGSDNTAWGDDSGIKVADKDGLIYRVAEINEDKTAFFAEAEGNEAAYAHAMEVLKNITASQDEVDQALADLGGHVDSPDERLAKAKQAAKDALNAYDPDDYREAERELLAEYVAEGIAEIDAAEDLEAVRAALIKAQARIDALITDMEYTAIEEAASADIDKVYRETGDLLSGNGTPYVGSIGGEWVVIGLERADHEVPDNWEETYYARALKYVKENIDENGRLHPVKSTDNARLILALTSMGKDPRNVGGYDLTGAFDDLEYIKKQGINGPIWALLALDSHGYEIPVPESEGAQLTREILIQTILDARLEDGGWALTGERSDVDLTAMSLQALAPYGDDPVVATAIEEALELLSGLQNGIGGFSSYGANNTESCAQVIVALTALGIDPVQDERFIKNNINVLQAMCSYAVDGGGFIHVIGGDLDGMSTEQGYYALASWYRFKEGKTRLYDMSDVVFDDPVKTVEDMIEAIGDNVSLDDEDLIEAARDAYEALSAEDRARVSSELLDILKTAEEAIAKLKEEQSGQDGNSSSPGGSTVVISEGETVYQISEATKEADKAMKDIIDATPEDKTEFTDEEIQDIVEAYEKYAALSPDEKLFAKNYKEFEEKVLSKLADDLHYDKRTGTDARDNTDSALPWHVRLEVKDDSFSEEELAKLAVILGEDFSLDKIYSIGFTDILTGKSFDPKSFVSVKFPVPESGSDRTMVFIYVKDDGSLDCFEAKLSKGSLVMERKEFGTYGIADSSLSWEEIVEGRKPEESKGGFKWLALSGTGLAGLVLIFFLTRRKKVKMKTDKF